MTEQTKAAISFSLIVGLGIALMLSLCWQYEEEPAKTITFEDLLDAIEWVESKGDPNAIGDNGNAVGSLQIWKIYVDDVNRIASGGSAWASEHRYIYTDRWNREKSREMTSLYIDYYSKKVINANPKLLSYCPLMKWFEIMARIHNGGPNGYKKESTRKYWLKIKKYLNNLR